MRLAYYQNPELQLFDPERCTEFPRILPQIWDGFNFDNIDNVRIYKGDELQRLDVNQKRLAIVNVTSQVNRDIATCRYANRGYRIYYVSQTFYSAMMKCYEKMRPLMDEDNALRTVYEDAVFIFGKTTLVFTKLKDDQFRFMGFDEGRLAHISDFSINDDAGETLSKYQDMDTMTVVELDEPYTPDLFLYQHSFILFFKKYGNVDIETVEGNTTITKSKVLGEKVNNYTGIDVQLLDSHWFTTICRDEGFMVSGHFRLQPCKDEHGRWTRKIIYIKPFAKKGYHRVATRDKMAAAEPLHTEKTE